ncbi:MAG: DUF1552 domain-containing protein [Planctomycetaceae bacterium]|nr:DUF1552 domain-containing protein [Planctomycetaceae bacterium]
MKSTFLHRRTLLRGAGAAMGLPLLDIMQPAAQAAHAPTAPVRMAYVFFPNGAIMDRWNPKGDGAEFQFNDTMSSLEPHRNDLLILQGLAQHHARANGDGGGDHARNASAFLTGAQPRKTSGADIFVGTSIDQAAAQLVGNQTRLPSLELGIERGRNAGNCDSGYSCAYSTNISWRSPTTPTAKEINPRLAFERIFGTREAAVVEERRNKYRKSILDFVADDARRLQGTLGSSDRHKLDEYFSSVREIEQRIDRANHLRPQEIPEMDLPEGVPGELTEHLRLMYDIMILALQTDSTRIITFMVGDAGCNRTYREVEVKNGHHELSHHRDDPEKIAQIARIDRYLVDQFAAFLSRMKAVKEGDGNLLDNSMVLYGSAISDGMRHSHDHLPILLAGHGGGTIRSGRVIRMKDETPLNNLFLSMADRVGAKIPTLGNSTGMLDLS